MPLHPARYTIEGTLVVKETVHEQSDRGEDGNIERRDEMRKLVAVTQMTLDGVMQAPGGPEEDPSGGFEQGGWSVPYFGEALRPPAGTQNLRDLRRPLAVRRGPDCGALQRRDQVRRFEDARLFGVEQLDPTPRNLPFGGCLCIRYDGSFLAESQR